ncbi:7-deoxyloganetin glucosyltransferase-like [Magnolia sinica]|uniref:7-deoxyloganetin glucosyltransferase-like n=1 Tax=Magnolia sinica TaxID=86752 RepID=UPI0026596707|nr:7-deoxyloganetin glucosyltransferase-like [Magnolia sinica]
MDSSRAGKPHAVFIPYPAQGHINPLLNLAKLFHFRGFHITYVHTEYNYQRLLRSRGPDSVKGLEDFRFETIPDGLPPSDNDETQDIPTLCISTRTNCVIPFRNLIKKLNKDSSDVPPVSCIIADGFMTFTLQVAEELGILELVFWTMSACGAMTYLYFKELIQRGYTPLKDKSYLTNGYLDTPIDWIPGMKGIRLRDLPSFVRTTDRNDILLNFDGEEAQNAYKAWGVILNTFDDFEREVVDALRLMFPRLYTVGSLSMLVNQLPENGMESIVSSLWKEDPECLKWLDTREAGSVVYVNFGSITVMTAHQLREFAWGLANSKHPFLWIIRPDLVKGDSAIVPEDFIEETKGRCLIASWCPQEQVLAHPSVGGFLTHSGWNSTLESVCSGVPMICWPFFSEQLTNCRYACKEWGIGMEIDNNAKREEVEYLVRELIDGEKGMEMRKKAIMWKESAIEATKQGGSSFTNLDRMIRDILQESCQQP